MLSNLKSRELTWPTFESLNLLDLPTSVSELDPVHVSLYENLVLILSDLLVHHLPASLSLILQSIFIIILTAAL